jgi:hypothetical protein
MTYKELIAELQQLSEEQLNTDVTIFVRGVEEFYPASSGIYLSTDDDAGQILDANHPYLMI